MKEVRLQLVFFLAPFIRFGSLSHLECGSCYYSLDQKRRDAWDIAAEICLSQLPSSVEDRNAEFQV
ncbi:hypothetical protein E1A91_A04G089900v1 [Gossypium mustelinum]|uniref:Uncharacterized protein n=1 Tax=Gossypium mustelinum TaxID=34275 RepID=A0A5D2ZLB6_GOSMU|nr:hypothetical protein E1A91_A04G089900v1 [Gossypium mustelinum]